MAKEKLCGIYCIENLINDKKYIGQSVDIYSRWVEHKWELKNKKHKNTHLQNSWNKYGENNFKFDVVELCTQDELNDKEQYWIFMFDSFVKGYNQTMGGDGCVGKQWTLEERERNSRSVLQISMNGEVINRFINCRDASEITGVNSKQIWSCASKLVKTEISHNGNKHQRVAKTAGGYIWVYEDEIDDFDLNYHLDTRSIPIKQYDRQWNLIKCWPSSEATKHVGYNPTTIADVCKGKFKQAYGFIWTYEDVDLDQYIEWYNDYFDIKYIGQYTLEGELVKIWDSPSSTKIDGFNPSLVRDNLKGKYKKHRGYIFKYIPWRQYEKITKENKNAKQ